MVTARLLGVLPLLALIEASYPSQRSYYSGNRYGYGGHVRRSPVQWVPYRPVLRSQRSPLNYYTVYPYSNYLEDYYRLYPQEYPLYYPRSAKYDMYQSAVPSYYQKPEMNDGYDGYYYDMDPTELQEEILQEVEREEREESQPIGHELLYENEDYGNMNNYDRASMAYFQNLLAQKNKDLAYKQRTNNPYTDYSEDYGNEWQDIPATKLPPFHSREDKEVQDLRMLKNKATKNKQKLKENDPNYYYQRHHMHDDQKRSSFEDISKYITSSVPKTQVKSKENQDRKSKVPATSTAPPVSSDQKKEKPGQKEEVMMRPATPVRHPFNTPLMNMMINDGERKRAPSVFDTLKRMLEMEKSLKNKYGDEPLRPVMKKRIISDEDSLIRQLSVLKKSQ